MTIRSLGAGVATLAATLALAAPADAAIGTWAGSVGTTGKIALDVKINRQGYVTKVKQLRVKEAPATCDITTGAVTVTNTFPSNLKIQGDGSFGGIYTQPTYGNQTSINARFNRSGRKITGTVDLNYHYLNPPPEENCYTGPLSFKAKYNAPDETVSRVQARR
jgi:hypothetical protein